MASQDSQKHETTVNPSDSAATPKQRARKSAKAASTAKKIRRRGVGVAQLERLRLQERWNRMTTYDQLESLNLPARLQYPTNTGAVFPPFNNVYTGFPMQRGAPFYGGPSVMGFERNFVSQGVGINGVMGCNQQQQQQHVVLDPYRATNGAFIQNVVPAQGVLETPKELSSIPNIAPVSDLSDLYFKRKCTDGGFNGEREKFLKLSPGPEVIALHRKGEKDVLMEYEFFPEKTDTRTSCTEYLIPETNEASPSVGMTKPATSVNNSFKSTSVDLSLKL